MAKRSQTSKSRSTVKNIGSRLARVEAVVQKLTRTRVNVRREEHEEVRRGLRQLQRCTDQLEGHTRDLEIQFTRIAQIQADLDDIKRAWTKTKLLT